MAVFYKISCPSNNHTSYLMGTFHLNHIEFKPLLEKAYDLMASSRHYYGEMDLTKIDPVKVQDIMHQMPKAGKVIISEIKKKHRQIHKNFGLDILPLTQMPIFSVLNELTIGLFHEKLIPGSIDEELIKKAVEYKLTIGGIESFEEQLSIMQKLKQKDLENQVIKMLKKPEIFNKSMAKLFKWYLKGKTGKLHKNARSHAKANTSILIDKRNKIMASRIYEIVLHDNKNFFSFGAGHLNGRTGIIKLLMKKGLVIEKIRLP